MTGSASWACHHRQRAALKCHAAGTDDEALRIIETCIASEDRKDHAFDTPEVDSAHFACLEALGKEDDLRHAMWTRFESRLCAETLRRHLSRLAAKPHSSRSYARQNQPPNHSTSWRRGLGRCRCARFARPRGAASSGCRGSCGGRMPSMCRTTLSHRG